MAFTTRVRGAINRALAPLNIQLGSLTAERRERRRLADLARAGLFERAVYALSPGMAGFDTAPMVAAYTQFQADLARLTEPGVNVVGYDPNNTYYASPDSDVLYLLVRSLAPNQIVEIGCGNSTRISRQAIKDGGLSTRITAIDPWPRNDIAPFVDAFHQSRVEHLESYALFESLEAGDVLFVDSSHEMHLGNDVARIFCDIIPRLKPGVILHFHDIFIPYEYVEVYSEAYAGWGEQYVLHALLQGRATEMLWPGHYLQRTRPAIASELPFMANGIAQSFWFRLL